jgi:translocator protein
VLRRLGWKACLPEKNVKAFLATLRTPPLAPPFFVSAMIGVLYYAICFFILFRLFSYDDNLAVRRVDLALLLVVMAVNAFWNYGFFRRRDLRFSFALSVFYSLVAVALFICLLQFDYVAAFVEVPYLLYLSYAFYWSYELLKLNPGRLSQF